MTLIRQRVDKDCGVAALAALAGISYEDAYVAVAQVNVYRGKQGLWNWEVVQAARKLGIRLTPTRTYDLEEHDGILRVRFRGERRRRIPGGHFVAVRDGQIYCSADAMVLPSQDYFDRWRAYGCTLLQEAR